MNTRCLVLTSGRAADGPYGVDRLARFGYDLAEVVSASNRVHRKLRDVMEHRSSLPIDKTVRSAWKASRADFVLAFLVREALSESWAKRRGLWPYAGRPLVMIACWLADEILSMPPVERNAAIERYSGVDLILVFSRNQVEILVEAGFERARVEAVTFGYDPGQFPPSDEDHRSGIVAVGADRRRDFGTLILAMRGSGLALDLYTGEAHVQHETFPPR
ncbi:hypothetical protein MHY29_01610 [Micrococcus sp. ACRRV]|uniref:hypothetical protein n=1 Tax=Micrococcus sp. ACRRV TaxID=2918203 RepID=UPI001EF39F47|nr:hypothetical protein [Micrococcus sp. ACRRV]MCG7421548.1 hypothetical protein [Micrococcus sp. ACRRV]